MISWFNAPNEGLSPGGQLTLKTLTATENKTYSEEGTAYTSVTVNVEGGGGSSDIWSIAFNKTEYKIEGFNGTYEGESMGHNEYKYSFNRGLVPEEVASNSYYTEKFAINIGGNDITLIPFALQDYQSQGEGSYVITIAFEYPDEGDDVFYSIEIITGNSTETITCPDINIVSPTDDAIALVNIMT